MNLPQKNDLYLLILTIITLPITIYSYLMVVFSDDIHVYFGVAKIADYFGSFPSNIDLAWESKPLLNRMIFYGLYKIFAPLQDNELLFQIGTKAAVAVVILCVCAYLAREVCKKCEHLNAYAVFLILALSLFTLHVFCIMECEFFAIIGSFLVLAMLMSESRWANMAAGVVMVGVFLLKGLTGIMIPIILISWCLLDKTDKWNKSIYAIKGIVGAAVVFAASCILWFPNFIPDNLVWFSMVKPNGLSLVDRTYQLVKGSLTILWFVPILCMGLIAFVYVVWDYIKSKEYTLAAILAATWVLALSLTYIQSEFFIYHYSLWVFPAVISILLFLSARYGKSDITGVLMVVGFTLCIWLVTSSVWTSGHEGIWGNVEADSQFIKQTYLLDKGESILYMDFGNAAYYLGNPSACRYIVPLTIHHSNPDRDLSGLSEYKQQMECIMNYRGNYIIFSPQWFGVHEPANTKIATEYREVYKGDFWNLYQKVNIGS